MISSYTCTRPGAPWAAPYAALLSQCGLLDEGDADFTVLLLDDDEQLLACGSLRGRVLKQIAVRPSAEQAGLCAQIVTELTAEAVRRGASHLFLFTAPEHRQLFRSLGFFPVVESGSMLMTENRADGIASFLRALPHPSGAVGAVVCNCNPFTLGHRALIEHAAARCDAVLVFVLSEEGSLFPAEDRFALVRAGTADLGNVFVVRSAEYLVSRATFPAYFLKDSASPEQARCDLDLLLFARRIAPDLHITRRFVGAEPFDPVTRHYNERMHALLPPLGVEVVEIPRYRGISASAVRALLQSGRVRETQNALPPSTYAYCLRHFADAATAARQGGL